MALLFLGGQTIYDTDSKKPLIYVDKIDFTEDKIIKKMVCVHDGESLVNVSGYSLCHIFTNDVDLINRTLYHGRYCNGSIFEGIDEDNIVKNKAGIKKYLTSVSGRISKNTLFVKRFNKDKKKSK